MVMECKCGEGSHCQDDLRQCQSLPPTICFGGLDHPLRSNADHGTRPAPPGRTRIPFASGTDRACALPVEGAKMASNQCFPTGDVHALFSRKSFFARKDLNVGAKNGHYAAPDGLLFFIIDAILTKEDCVCKRRRALQKVSDTTRRVHCEETFSLGIGNHVGGFDGSRRRPPTSVQDGVLR